VKPLWRGKKSLTVSKPSTQSHRRTRSQKTLLVCCLAWMTWSCRCRASCLRVMFFDPDLADACNRYGYRTATDIRIVIGLALIDGTIKDVDALTVSLVPRRAIFVQQLERLSFRSPRSAERYIRSISKCLPIPFYRSMLATPSRQTGCRFITLQTARRCRSRPASWADC
jgi:hypothetical protein